MVSGEEVSSEEGMKGSTAKRRQGEAETGRNGEVGNGEW
jgi:hypothetical protein